MFAYLLLALSFLAQHLLFALSLRAQLWCRWNVLLWFDVCDRLDNFRVNVETIRWCGIAKSIARTPRCFAEDVDGADGLELVLEWLSIAGLVDGSRSDTGVRAVFWSVAQVRAGFSEVDELIFRDLSPHKLTSDGGQCHWFLGFVVYVNDLWNVGKAISKESRIVVCRLLLVVALLLLLLGLSTWNGSTLLGCELVWNDG